MTPHSQPVGAPELKPCPFCADKMRVVTGAWKEGMLTHSYQGAPSCVLSNLYFTFDDWNRRAPSIPMPQGIAEAIAEMRAETFMTDPKRAESEYRKVQILCDTLESSLQRLALMESLLPRVYTAETIKHAPEGDYWVNNGTRWWPQPLLKSDPNTDLNGDCLDYAKSNPVAIFYGPVSMPSPSKDK